MSSPTSSAPSWRNVLEFKVLGLPVPQGSTKAIPLGRRQGNRFVPICRPDGMPIVNVTSDNDALKAWRSQVMDTATDAWGGADPLDEPVQVWIDFAFPWRQGDYGTGRNAGKLKDSAPLMHSVRPDIDKLCRAMLDGLTDAKVIADDGRVVELHARKRYGLPTAKLWLAVWR